MNLQVVKIGTKRNSGIAKLVEMPILCILILIQTAEYNNVMLE